MLTVQIETDNAAFEESAGAECARILRKLADKIEGWRGANNFTMGLLDINGNRVGEAFTVGNESDEGRKVKEWDEEAEHANDLRHESRVADEQERRGE